MHSRSEYKQLMNYSPVQLLRIRLYINGVRLKMFSRIHLGNCIDCIIIDVLNMLASYIAY